MASNGKPGGKYLSAGALRTASVVDSAANTLNGATFLATPKVNVRGDDVFVQIGGITAANTVVAKLVYYDADDNIMALGDSLSLVSGTYLANVANASGTLADRYISDPEIGINPDATFARLLIISLSTAELVDFFVYTISGGDE